jgi:hypothetical protein
VTVFARLARAAGCVAACALLLGCAREATPSPLLGTWYSEDARFDGRTLQIHPQWIRFMEGTKELGAVRIEGVLQEGGGEGPIRFEIEGVDRDGQETTLSFELVQRPTERLRLETQREPWRRMPRTEGST